MKNEKEADKGELSEQDVEEQKKLIDLILTEDKHLLERLGQ